MRSIFGRRSSNVRRNRWAVELLEIQPTDRVIELGCGPGVAVAALADRATRGLVVGVDHSQDAGFTVVRVETLDLAPPAVCVLAAQPDGE